MSHDNVKFIKQHLPHLCHVKDPSRTEHYSVINTLDAAQILQDYGFKAKEATYMRPRTTNEDYKKYGRHKVLFIHPDIEIGDSFGQYISDNSYDGLSAYRGIAGVFRSACSNGMMFGLVGDTGTSLRVKHMSLDENWLKNNVEECMKKIESDREVVKTLSDYSVDDEYKLKLALELAQIRFDSLYPKSHRLHNTMEVLPETLLEPIRDEDKGNNLWITFNIIQEKLLNGGFISLVQKEDSKKERKMKGIINVVQRDDINLKLWEYLTKNYTHL